MGFRFRRSVRLLPGVRVNLSGSGVSTSVGVRGASVTVGKRGVRANIRLPGTGLSYSTRLDGPEHRGNAARRATPARGAGSPLLVVLAILGVIVAFGACAVVFSGG